ncbi:MAG: hypothetical protein KF764_06530 [Labilithrix sp.]|nr:hypothetical protein [Labilithrix sp.]
MTPLGSPDPLGDVIGFVPLVLAAIGALQALFFASIVFYFEAAARRAPALLEPAPAEPQPRPA